MNEVERKMLEFVCAAGKCNAYWEKHDPDCEFKKKMDELTREKVENDIVYDWSMIEDDNE